MGGCDPLREGCEVPSTLTVLYVTSYEDTTYSSDVTGDFLCLWDYLKEIGRFRYLS